MDKAPKNRRGRPRKLMPWVVRFGCDTAKWERWLRSVGNPKELRWDFYQQGSMPAKERDVSGRKIRPTKDLFGESANHRSVTQRTNFLASIQLESALDESVGLSDPWLRHLEYMDVVAEALSPKDNGATLKRLFLEDARSRYREIPEDFPVELGTPKEFRTRWESKDLEIRLEANRRRQLIKIAVIPIPPDEPEDLNEAEEPDGHWEGLRWFPAPSRKDHS